MDLFVPVNESILAIAQGPVTAAAIDTTVCQEQLMHHAGFLQLVASSVSGKLNAIISHDVSPTGLPQRVMNFIRFKCPDGTLRGVEQAAFRLHCSPRQLQRILNQFRQEGLVTRLGKGQYQLVQAGKDTAVSPVFRG